MKKTCLILSAVLAITLLASCSKTSKEEINYDTKTLSKDVNVESDVIAEEVADEETEAKVEEVEEKISESECDVVQVDEPKDDVQPVKRPVKGEYDIQYNDKKLIASSSTIFNPYQTNRASNIRLASNYISGIVLKPNDEFSFNGVVGERTAERGFLPAGVFSGNSVVQGYGGGICQVSSTMCIAVKQTSMKIVEQNPHSMRVSYTTIENEAMINYGTSDFRFINTYDFPVMIEISFEPSSDTEVIKCNIYGLE